ncbi:MAG TPA: carboxypeptidase-like regulatory domain-containing protein, partial [Solirubrobacteraceae bacterium]|nr:carboxypeptidase-like regulatory domain-containing protein [Solirubrobacteraceae bacterium]
AFTGATGGYAVTGLGAGGYTVKFTPPAGGADLVGEFYRQRPNGDGDLVAVTAGELTGGIDTQLEAGGRITGTVTGPSGAPAAGAGVLLTTGGGREVSQWGQVGADGTYAIDDLAPGSYTVRFEAPLGSGLENQYYPGAASLAAAGPVTVAPGATTSGIDARLPRAGIVTGTVIDTLGHPVAGVGVFAFDANAPLPERPSFSGLPLFRATVTTDASGHFELDGLAATSYRVFFSSPDYVPRYYGGSGTYDTATLLTVSASTSTVLADTPIQLAGAIAGTVRDAAGRPLEAFVTVLRGDGTPAGFTVSAGGAYRIGNLAPGRYLVRFAPTTSPDAFFYDGRATEGAADAVTVVAGSTTGGIDGRVPGPNLAASGPVLGDLHGALVVSRRGSVRVPVRCVGPTGCAGTASLSTLAPGAKGRAHRVRIGWSAFRVGPGRTASQRLLLTVAGRRLLRRHHGRMTAELLVARTGSRGHPATTQLRSA